MISGSGNESLTVTILKGGVSSGGIHAGVVSESRSLKENMVERIPMSPIVMWGS